VGVETDNDIVRASQARPAVFSELFDRHAVSIHRYAARRAGGRSCRRRDGGDVPWRGVAIGRLETASDTRQELVFDQENGLLIGEREVAVDWDDLPAGTVVASTAVTTRVVDAAP
jgi:hypothetical protein